MSYFYVGPIHQKVKLGIASSPLTIPVTDSSRDVTPRVQPTLKIKLYTTLLATKVKSM